jgi:2-amino-4-hydroxy-6-hydroxymethyldihydropteridine diphosphokinase
MKAGVALGSNLGDRLLNLRTARKAIAEIPGVTKPISSSWIYETDPVDCEPDANSFLNAAIEFEFTGEPAELLRRLREIENSLGRPPNHARNISRQIDLDLLYFGDAEIKTGTLRLPHPRMHERKFVLQPLADIRPELVLPGHKKTVRELLALLDDSAKVVRQTNDWEPA